VTGADTLVQQFDKVRKSRFWGLSKRVRSRLSDADDATTDAITNTVNSLQAGVRASAEALGISADAFDDFSYRLRISTKGMSGEAAQQAVQNALAGMADAMASMAPGMSAFSDAGNVDALIAAAARERDATKAAINAPIIVGTGETWGRGPSSNKIMRMVEADRKFANASAEIRRAATAGNAELLSRFARSLLTVNASMETLGLTVRSVSLESGAASDAFAALFGGLERFTEVSQFYYENFYSDAERVARATQLLSAELKRFGVDSIPATREAFRAIVEWNDAAGKSGVVAGLMQLGPAFIGVRDGIDALAAAAKDAGTVLDSPATREAARIAAERFGIETQLARVLGNTLELRRRELEALDPTNRALMEYVHSMQDAESVTSERLGLEKTLLALQGNTNELRRRELEALDPANRALQQMIWGLEEAAKAMADLNPDLFATMFDFQLAQAVAANGPGPANSTSAPMSAPSYTAPVATDGATVIELREMNRRMQRMEDEQRQYHLTDMRQGKKSSDTLQRWEAIGLPVERTS